MNPNSKIPASETLRFSQETWLVIDRLASEAQITRASLIEAAIIFVLAEIDREARVGNATIDTFFAEQFQGFSALISRMQHAAVTADMTILRAQALIESMGHLPSFVPQKPRLSDGT